MAGREEDGMSAAYDEFLLGRGMGGAGNVVAMPLTLQAARLPDPQAIPPRAWLYGTRLIRGFVTVLVAPGGTGKSTYALGVAMCLAAGRKLLGDHVHRQVNAWVMNLEDPLEEMERRVAAMMMRHGLKADELRGRLFLHSGRDRRLFMAAKSADGYEIVHPDEEQVIRLAIAGQIGTIVVDPFVKSHSLEENSNADMDAAVTAWARVAEATGAAIFLVHHTRKGPVMDIDAARGGKALTDGSRVGLTMAAMTAEEAEQLGIPADQRWRYVRLDDAKANMAPRAAGATWFRMEMELLGNGTVDYPNGDRVAALAVWEPENVLQAQTPQQLNAVLDRIAEGPGGGRRYAPTRRGASNARWVGLVLVEMLGINETQAGGIVSVWLKSGLLAVSEQRDPETRKSVAGVDVIDAKRPT